MGDGTNGCHGVPKEEGEGTKREDEEDHLLRHVVGEEEGNEAG